MSSLSISSLVVMVLIVQILAEPQVYQSTSQQTPGYSQTQQYSQHIQQTTPYPYQYQQTGGGSTNTPVSIVSQTEVIGTDGTFNFSFESGDGTRVSESGYIKQSDNLRNANDSGLVQVIQGSYSYIAPNGQNINLRYIADENGFQPEGEHIPTTPPVPGNIARSFQTEQYQQQPGQFQQQPGQHQQLRQFQQVGQYQQQSRQLQQQPGQFQQQPQQFRQSTLGQYQQQTTLQPQYRQQYVTTSPFSAGPTTIIAQ